MAIGAGNEGIFSVLEGIAEWIGNKVGGTVLRAVEGMGSLGEGFGGSNSLGGGSLLSSMKDVLSFGGDKAPEISAPQRTPEVAIQAPAVAMSKYEVSMDELGNLAPPSVGSAARSNGMGMTA